MNRPSATFGSSVRAALIGLQPVSLAAIFAAPLVTALVADARVDACTDEALAEVIAALVQVGLPRGRVFVLLGGDSAPHTASVRARTLARSLAVPVLLHDPAAASFTAGRLADGTDIALDDELREAEAIVSVGPWEGSAGRVQGGPFLLCPGLASSATRAAFAAAGEARGNAGELALAAAAEQLVPVDLAVWWSRADGILVANGRRAGEHAARAAGFA